MSFVVKYKDGRCAATNRNPCSGKVQWLSSPNALRFATRLEAKLFRTRILKKLYGDASARDDDFTVVEIS